jgi:hypothetical protein
VIVHFTKSVVASGLTLLVSFLLMHRRQALISCLHVDSFADEPVLLAAPIRAFVCH